jgi:DNA primase large subunit
MHRVIKDVLDKVRGKHYQLACGLAFEGITGAQQETGINKPSEYYAASIELEKQRAAAAAAGGTGGLDAGGGGGGTGAAQQAAAGPPATPAPAGSNGAQRQAP